MSAAPLRIKKAKREFEIHPVYVPAHPSGAGNQYLRIGVCGIVGCAGPFVGSIWNSRQVSLRDFEYRLERAPA